MMRAKAVLNQQVSLDYAERLMERDFLEDPFDPLNVNKLGKTNINGANALSEWELDLWETHRLATGHAAIWDWS